MTSNHARYQSAKNSMSIFDYQVNDVRKSASGSGCVGFWQPKLALKNRAPPQPTGHQTNDVYANACRWGDNLVGNPQPLYTGTRVKKACNTLSGVTFPTQWDPIICDSRAYRLASNSVIGMGSRNSVKDSLHYAMYGNPSPFNAANN